MSKDDEILTRLMSIESTNDEIYKELIRLQNDLKVRRVEEFQTKTLVEDIYDYIKINSYEKKVSEKVESKEEI